MADPLREIAGVRQDEPARTRRWFQNNYFDLFVWQGADGEMVAFQLCYDIGRHERAFSWKAGAGFFHDGVDADQSKPGRSASAILVSNGPFPAVTIGGRFARDSADIPDNVRAFVLARIDEYAARPPSARAPRRRVRRADWQRRED